MSKNQQINGQLRFVAFNAKGKQNDYFMAYVRLSPTGDFALKSDEWQALGFSVEILELNPTTPAVLIDGRPGHRYLIQTKLKERSMSLSSYQP